MVSHYTLVAEVFVQEHPSDYSGVVLKCNATRKSQVKCDHCCNHLTCGVEICALSHTSGHICLLILQDVSVEHQQYGSGVNVKDVTIHNTETNLETLQWYNKYT